MLSFFRRGIMAKVMLAVLFLSLVAIVITGFGTGGAGGLGELGGLRAGSIASVGGERLTSDEVKQATQRQLDRLRQENPELDMTSFIRRGALQEVVDQLIDVAATVLFARQHGLGVSKAMVDREIAGIPGFQDVTGKFDAAAFRAALERERMTEADLRKDIEQTLLQRQLVLPAAGSAHVPGGLAFQYASLLLESRTAIVGSVPSAALGAGGEPNEAEIASFYQQSRPRYTIPERRVIRYAVFGTANVAAQSQASEAEIAAAYKQNPAYAARETRTLSQVVLQDQKAAQALAQKVAAGTPFAAAAAQAGYSAADIALGAQTREQFTAKSSAAVAAAAFGAANGGTIGPVRSPFGWHVVHVDNIAVSAAKPLAAVRGEIAAQIQQRKAQEAVNDLASRIENAIQDGASFDEIARSEKLAVVETAPVTQTGASPDTPGWQPSADLRPLLEGAFALEPGQDPGVETIQENQRYALVAVSRAIPAAPPPLAQIRERVRADLLLKRASERARAVATAIVAKINAGTPPAQAFAQAQVKLPPVQTVTATRRDIAREGAQVTPAAAMMFNLPRGKARLVPQPQGQGWTIVYLDKVVRGDASKEPPLLQAVRGQFAQIIGDEYAQQFMTAIRSGLKVKRNDEALRKLRNELLGTSGDQAGQ
ncbi:MAG TPA: SurA N-terminal domain-containing protein [Allosphingosinicella sp.]|nr:SurA N-terminal domain-containing protein [Allosphingosinicella sp.]